MTTETITTAAGRYWEQFETAWRVDGAEYVRVRDDAPDKGALTDLLREIHSNGHTLPIDALFAATRQAFGYIHDNGDGNGDYHDMGHEFADGWVDHDYDALVRWLTEAPMDHAQCIEEAIEELGPSDRGFWHTIQMGQYIQNLRVFDAVVTFLEGESE